MLESHALSFSIRRNFLIREISLSFQPGILYGIVGPNGSGKSTFLKCLSGIWKPTSGNVTWNKENLHQRERRLISQIISFVPPNPPLHFDFSVKDIVAMGRYSHRKAQAAENNEIIEWSLNVVDAWHLRDRRATHLSNGERQRIYIARALATESPAVLLDEPTSSLDIRHQLDIWQLLQDLAAKGKTIIVANHDLQAVKRYCNQIVVLYKGETLSCGSCKEALTPDILQEAFQINSIFY